jgi:predicted nuclease of predicted toxin-antitoxin system
LAEALARDGVDACHIRDRGMLEASDRDVLERGYPEDRILVTANVGDFTRLAAARELHAGIVLLEAGDLRRKEQLEVLRRVVTAAGARQFDLLSRFPGAGAVWIDKRGEVVVWQLMPLGAG